MRLKRRADIESLYTLYTHYPTWTLSSTTEPIFSLFVAIMEGRHFISVNSSAI